MNTTHLRRSLAAVGTALVCLVVMANPAAATPVNYNATITGGRIVLSKTGVTEVIDLVPTTPSCTTPSTLQAHFTSNNTSSNVDVTNLNSSHIRTFGTTGTYLAVLTRSTVGNSAGHITSQGTPAHTVDSMRVGIQIRIYNTAGTTDPCAPNGPLVCTLGVLLHLNGTSTSISSSNTFSLTGASVGTVVALAPGCAAGPSYLLGTTSAVTVPITGHLSTTF